MNGYEEIDLMDLLFYCLKKWRWFIIMMFFFAMVTGIYKYQAIGNENIEKQKLLLEEKIKEETDIEESETIPVLLEDPVSEAIKFAAMGCAMGAFFMVFLFTVKYVMCGKLQNVKNFEHDFGMHLLGMVLVSEKKRWFDFIDIRILRLEKGTYAELSYEEQIRITVSNIQNAVSKEKEIKRIMLAGTIEKEEAEAVALPLTAELKEATFTLSDYKQMLFQSSALNDLKKYDGIIFIEKEGKSYFNYIISEKSLAIDREVKIFGTIIF